MISITIHYFLIFTSTITVSETVCSLGDLDLNDCLKTEISNRFTKLHNPNKEVPFDMIDPFWFQYGQLAFNGSEKVHGKFTLKNITLYGGSKNVI